MGSLGTAVLDLTVNSAGLVSGLAAAEGGTKSKLGKMSATGKKLTAGLTLPILGAAAASVKLRADFDASMDKVVGLVGISRDQVNAWEDDLLKMATNVGKAPKELAEGLFFVTSAGLRGKDALDALEVSAKASAAGMGETATIADAVTSAMNSYGKESMSAAKATDVLVATVRAGKMEASELGPVLGNILPIASELGVSFEEVGGSLAQMTRLGMNAAAASTSLQAIMSGLLKPTKDSRKALKEVGLSFDDLKRVMAQDGIVPMLQLLNERFDGNVDAMARVFPNVRALKGVLALAGKAGKDTEAVFKDVADNTGALDHAFKEAAGNNFQFQRAMAALQVAAVELGAVLLPIAADVARVITKMAAGFAGLPGPVKQVIVVVMVLVAVIGPFLMMLPALVAGIQMLGAALLFLATNPVGWVIMAIVALVLIVIHLWKTNEAFREGVKEAWRQIVAGVKSAYAALRVVIAAIIGAFRSALRWVQSNWKLIILYIAGPFRLMLALAMGLWGLKDAIISAFNSVVTFIRTTMTRIVNIVGSIVGAVRAKGGQIGRAIIDGVRAAAAGLANLAGYLAGKIGSAISSAAQTAYGYAVGIGAKIVSGVITGLGGLFGAIRSKAQSAISGALRGLNPFSPVEHGGELFIGRPIVEGALTGLRDLEPELSRALSVGVNAGVTGATMPSSSGVGRQRGGSVVNVSFGHVIGSDERTLARELARMLKPELDRRAAF